MGSKGAINENITWLKIYGALGIAFVLFFLNTLLLPNISTFIYILTLALGYIVLMMVSVWMTRLLKNNLKDDVFNSENEIFINETKLMEEYSVNPPTKFWYNKNSITAA